jgi:hypothetical protein
MDKITAKQITARLKECSDLLSEVVQIAHAACNDAESKVVRRAVGYVLSEIQDRVGDPIYRERPDLLPKGADYAPLPGATLEDMA